MALRLIPMLAVAVSLGAAAPAYSAEKVLDRSFDVQAGGRLRVDVDGGSVIVTGSDSSKVVVRMLAQGSEDRLSQLKWSAERDGEGVTIVSKRDSSDHWLGWLKGSDGSLKVTVEVPRSYNLDLQTSGGHIDVKQLNGTAVGKTSGGRIFLENVTGDVRMRTSGGSVSAKALRGNALLETSGGSITTSDTDGELIAHTSGGGIRLERAKGRIDADTSGGGINIELIGPNQGIVAKTSGGGITLRVPSATKATLDASTSGGSVKSELKVATNEGGKSSLRGDINGGGPQIVARSSGGGIHINRAD